MAHMDFDIRIWRNYYDQINVLGTYLKDSYPDVDGNPPKFYISLSEKHKIEKEIDELMKNCDSYLDKCKVRPKDPLWHYDRTNCTTWASDEKFAYRHLVKTKKYITMPKW